MRDERERARRSGWHPHRLRAQLADTRAARVEQLACQRHGRAIARRVLGIDQHECRTRAALADRIRAQPRIGRDADAIKVERAYAALLARDDQAQQAQHAPHGHTVARDRGSCAWIGTARLRDAGRWTSATATPTV